MSDWWQCPRCTRTFKSTGDGHVTRVLFGEYDGVSVCGDCFQVLCNQASPEELRRHNDIIRQINEENEKRWTEAEARSREAHRKEDLAKKKFRKRPLLCFFNFLPFPMIVYSVLFFIGVYNMRFRFLIVLVLTVIFTILSVHGEIHLITWWKPAKMPLFYFKRKKNKTKKWELVKKDGSCVPSPLLSDYRLYILISLVVFVLGMAVSFGGATLGATPSDEQAVEVPAEAETAQEAEGN